MPDSVPPPQPAPEFFSPQVREARRFDLDLAPPPRQPLAVVCGRFEYSAPDYEIQRAGFPYYSIEFVARGKGTLVLAGQTVQLLHFSRAFKNVLGLSPEAFRRLR